MPGLMMDKILSLIKEAGYIKLVESGGQLKVVADKPLSEMPKEAK